MIRDGFCLGVMRCRIGCERKLVDVRLSILFDMLAL